MPINSPTAPTTTPHPTGRLLRGRFWPVGAIVAICFAVIAFFQITHVFDKGSTNILSGVSIGVSLILLALWMAFLAPFSLRARCCTLAVAALAILALVAEFRLEGFDGNMIPRF